MRTPKLLSRFGAMARARPRAAVGALVVVVLLAGLAGWRLMHRSHAEPAPASEPRTELVGGPAPRPDGVVTFAEGCATARCHAPMIEAPYSHISRAPGSCETCHAPDSGGHIYPLRVARGELCTSCHDTGWKHSFQHKAMSEESCLACHDPHRGATPALLRGATMGETCARCHPGARGTVKHKPYAADRCDSCHDPHGAENRSLIPAGGAPEACRACHADVVRLSEAGTHSHRGVTGSCLGCHEAHASNNRALLSGSTRDSCVVCHADVASAVSGATVSHDPVLKDQQCVTCHEPHASDNPKMLRDSQAQVCLSCHSKPVTGTDGRVIPDMASALTKAPVVHGAVRQGDCGACHSVHGGTHARLLREANAKALTDGYDAHNYALCFSCHDRSLAEAGAGTFFRDGERNLHEAHLRSTEGGRSCAACHAVHSSDLPRLIAREVSFEGSGWRMPIGFTITPDGGSCAPGCHEPLEYSRRPGGARALKPGGAK